MNKDHSSGLAYGCIHRLWEAVVCACVYVCVIYVYNTIIYVYIEKNALVFWGLKL